MPRASVLVAGKQWIKLAESRVSRKLATLRQYETLSCFLRSLYPPVFVLLLRIAALAIPTHYRLLIRTTKTNILEISFI